MTESKTPWPDQITSISEAKAWIQEVLPEHPTVEGPTALLNVKRLGWGVVARFSVSGCHDVVLKINTLGLFRSAPHAFELVHFARPDHTPPLIAHDSKGDQNWMLFWALDYPTVEEVGKDSLFVEMAREIARIQGIVASLPGSRHAKLPHFSAETIPKQFDELLNLLKTRYLPVFDKRRGAYLERFGFDIPTDLYKQLLSHRETVQNWTNELISMNWPDALDHVDLHSGNAFSKDDGSIAIIDWEEAQISCPFFSLDRLLEDAADFDISHGYVRTDPDIDSTPTTLAVKEAYLEMLPWRTTSERMRGLELALNLSPIKTMAEGETFNAALSREQGNPVQAAHLWLRALKRWTASV